MSIDRNDRLHLVWRQGTENKAAIRYRILDTVAATLNWGGAQTEVKPASGEVQMFRSVATANNDVYVSWTETIGNTGAGVEFPKETPNANYSVPTKTVLAKKLGTSEWLAQDVVIPSAWEGNTWWGSLRWSRDYLNGGFVDLVYESKTGVTPHAFEILHRSVLNWGQ